MKNNAISLNTFLICLLAGLLLPVLPAHTQDVVVVRIAPPAINQLSAADLWQVELTSMSRVPADIYLIGTVEREGEGLILEARSAIFSILPGLNRLTGREVQPVRVRYVTPRYRDAVMRTGSFPAGNYTLCADAFEAQTGRELGRDCLFHSVQPFSPPQLIAPVTDVTIHQPYPVFTWTPPAPLPPDAFVRYRIKIVRMHRAQTPETALQMNLSWFEDSSVMMTTLPYPAEARSFEEGNYAWFVEAVDSRSGSMIARSDVGVFQWKPLLFLPDPGLIAVIAPHGIPADLFEALMRPCVGTPDISVHREIIETMEE
jgi:hypothetical protein